jgi:Spy/CpxP family protein refolding chaperone
MTSRTKRITTAMGVAAMAIVLAGAGFQGGQVSAQGPGGRGGPGRFGGQGGPGGPGGPGRGRGGPGGPSGPGMLSPMMLDRLGLSDAQHEQVRQIMDAQKDDQRALGERAMKAHQALDAAITSDTLDEGRVRMLAADVATAEADMAVARARVYSQVFQILTPDQQSKLKQLQAQMAEREQRMQENRDQRRGDRQDRR